MVRKEPSSILLGSACSIKFKTCYINASKCMSTETVFACYLLYTGFLAYSSTLKCMQAGNMFLWNFH
jgi:hypothetical protein